MSRLLLDTSAYSAFFRGHRGIQSTLQEAEDIVLTPVVLGELRAGFMRGGKLRKNQEELQQFLESARVQVVAIDDETALRYAVILNALWTAGSPVPTNDIWIAASAMQYGLRLLTTDAHFQRIPQVIVDFHPIERE